MPVSWHAVDYKIFIHNLGMLVFIYGDSSIDPFVTFTLIGFGNYIIIITAAAAAARDWTYHIYRN